MDLPEFVIMKSHLHNFLSGLKSKVKNDNDKNTNISIIEDLTTESLNLGMEENGTYSVPSKEIIDDLWTRIEALVNNLSNTYKVIKNYAEKENFAPGFWLFAGEWPIDHGYSEHHVSLLQSKQNPNGRHTYNAKPQQLKWKLEQVVQPGSITYYIAIVPVNQIDAVASVPDIKPGIKTKKASVRVLNRELGKNQWQRSINSQRILKIGKFLDDEKNGVANAPLIFATENENVTFEKNSDGNYSTVSIDFDFLVQDQKDEQLLCDHQGLTDKRPLQIIDGQHRIRGAMRSSRGKELLIPIILFPPEIKSKGAAKFFAEINTLSEPLNVLHEIHMRHKFQLSSTKPDKDYEKYDGTSSTYRARANTLAYEAAAYCNLYSESLQNLIQILSENKENNHIVAADMWVKNSFSWFMPKGPYGVGSNTYSEDKEDWFEEICNFFDAFMMVCNNGFKDKENKSINKWLTHDKLRANDRGGNRPYIQYRTTFRALMHQLSFVTNRIRSSGYTEKVISTERFVQALRTLGNIDWTDNRIKSRFIPAGGGEYAWKCLRAWFRDALSRGEKEAYDSEEVMSEEIPSVQGKGILSMPKKGDIWFEDENHTLPTKDKPVRILSRRPFNAYEIAEGHLADEEGERLNESAKLRPSSSANSETRIAVFTVSYGDGWTENGNKTKLTVTWGNAVRKEVSSVIELK